MLQWNKNTIIVIYTNFDVFNVVFLDNNSNMYNGISGYRTKTYLIYMIRNQAKQFHLKSFFVVEFVDWKIVERIINFWYAHDQTITSEVNVKWKNYWSWNEIKQ